MAACADVNFVFQEVNYDWSGTYKKATGYTLIGREANVVAETDDMAYIASEESAIRRIEPNPDKVWVPIGGQPVVFTRQEG